MRYTNGELYQIFYNLNQFILSNEEIIFPIKVNFYIQKNVSLLIPVIEEIQKVQQKIINKYKNENEIVVEQEQLDKELKELSDISQEVNFYKITLNDLNDMQLTLSQMQSIIFMIEE